MSKHKSRRDFLKVSAVTGAATVLGMQGILQSRTAPAAIRRNRKPNILLVVTDQEQSWTDLPSQLELPARQKLAEKSVNFTNAHVVNPLCSMSRGNIYTGQHGQFTGLWENTPLPWGGGINDSVPTIGHFLKDAGYTTGYTGKWHLTHMGITGGLSKQATKDLFQKYGFDETFQAGERGGAHGGYESDPITVQDALGFIDNHKVDDKPWFLTTNLVNPHDIMYFKASQYQQDHRIGQFPDVLKEAPDHPLYKVDHHIPFPDNFGTSTRQGKPSAHFQKEGVQEAVLGEIPWTDLEAWERYRNYYFNCLRDVDRHIDTLLEGLEKSGEAENTIILFVADHGEMLGVHGHRGKGCLVYKEVTRVPLLISHPDVSGGVTSQALTSHIDIVPTILSLTGMSKEQIHNKYPFLKGKDFSRVIERPVSLGDRMYDGVLFQWSSLTYLDQVTARSFGKLKAAEGVFKKVEALISSNLSPGFQNRGHMRGVFDGRFKFARYFSPLEHHSPENYETLIRYNDLELYDTHEDPAENINLAQSPDKYKSIIRLMNQKLNRLMTAEVGVDNGSHMPGPTMLWKL